jgi:hypothetical protein
VPFVLLRSGDGAAPGGGTRAAADAGVASGMLHPGRRPTVNTLPASGNWSPDGNTSAPTDACRPHASTT